MSNVSIVLDFIGRQIQVNDIVVYPVRRGSKMWMQKIKVTRVEGGKDPCVIGFNSDGRQIVIHNIDNLVVVQLFQKAAA